jgi:hypothetical protein
MAAKRKRRRATGRKKTTRRKTRRRAKKATVRRRKKTKRRRRRRNPVTDSVWARAVKASKDAGLPAPKKKDSIYDMGAKAKSTTARTTKKKAKKKRATKKKAKKKKAKKRRASKKKATRRKGKTRRGYGTWSKKRGARWASASRSAKKAGRRKLAKTSSVKLRRGRRMSAWRKKKYVAEGKLSKRGHVNPGRRRRRRKRKKNPNFMATLRQLGRGSFWISGAQAAVGVSSAVVVPSLVEQLAAKVGLGRYVRNQGGAGVALTAFSVAVSMFASQVVEIWANKSKLPFVRRATRGLTARVGLGGILVTVIKGLEVFARRAHSYMRLPSIPAPVIRFPGISGPAPMAAQQMQGMGDWMQLQGMGDWMQLQGMGGMGGATSPEALVAGESFARTVSQFEGMGNMGYKIPMDSVRAPGQALAGYPGQYGMGDWQQFVSAPGSAGALAMSGGWEPSSVEAF